MGGLLINSIRGGGIKNRMRARKKIIFLFYTIYTMEEYITLIAIVLSVGIIMNRVTRYYCRSISEAPLIKKRSYDNVKYYSDGRLLPNPFYIEYKMLAETVPSCCAEVGWNIPAPNKYGYTNKHESLAISYLWDQKKYLGNLN